VHSPKKRQNFKERENSAGISSLFFLQDGQIRIDLQKKEMKIKELCMDERLKEKMLEKGAESLSNNDHLVILMRK